MVIKRLIPFARENNALGEVSVPRPSFFGGRGRFELNKNRWEEEAGNLKY